MSTAEKKLRFDRWCDAFGIDGERRDRLWSIMMQHGLDPDDVNVYFLGAAGVLEKVADFVKTSNDALPARIEKAARSAVGPVAEAATAKVEAAHAALTADVGQRVSELTERRLAIYERERTRKWNFTLIAGGVGLLTIGCLVGYGIGAANVSGLAADIAVFAKRADAATWLKLMATTPDLTGSVEKFCIPEAPETFKMLTGRQACGIWFWMDGNAAPQLKSVARGIVKTTSDAGSSLPWYLVGAFWSAVPFAIRWALKKMNAGTWLDTLSKALKN
jgi:hypothetical protein